MIYLDNNATTKIDEQVLNTMMPYLVENYGNASSIQHSMGRNASHAIESARQRIADILNVSTKELIFTSGATESINTVLKGVAHKYRSIGNHIITCRTEHKAVLSTCQTLEKEGFEITYLPVDQHGQIDLESFANALREDTILACIMAANNETGVIHPIAKISAICQKNNTLLFCDATQYMGKFNHVNLKELDTDILCFSAHKFHGPKGVGVLYIKRKSRPIQMEALIVGGNQEGEMRAGTYNVPQIVGLGKAMELFSKVDFSLIESLRSRLEERILSEMEEVKINGQNVQRLVNTSNITIKHVKSSELMSQMPNYAISSGSACVTGTRDPSHVLTAMGLSNEEAQCSIRISLSKFTTKGEIDSFCDDLVKTVERLRSQSPIWELYRDGMI